MTRRDLTVERLREVLDYDPETGHFTHKRRPEHDWRYRTEIFNVRFNATFAAMLAKIAAEFEAKKSKRRRGGRRDRRRPVAQMEPAVDAAPDFDLAEELR